MRKRHPKHQPKATHSVEPERFLVAATDAFSLHCARFAPPTGTRAARRVVIVCPATGVPARFYFSFAHYLAENGIATIVWDYRGIGASRPKSLVGFAGSIQDSIADMGCITRYVCGAFPRHRITIIGHSIGGVLALFNPAKELVERIVTVGAQPSCWRDWPARVRVGRFLDWHVFRPLVTSLVGYFPGRRLNLGEDLPRAFALAWGRCWRQRDGLLDELVQERALVSPSHVVVVGVTDDTIGTHAALRRLHGAWRARSVSYRWIDPLDHGLRAIGHFDLFRKRIALPAWPTMLPWVTGGRRGRRAARK